MSDETQGWDGLDRRKGERRIWVRRPIVHDGQAHGGMWRGRRYGTRRKKERRRNENDVRLEKTARTLRDMVPDEGGRRDKGIWISGGSVVLSRHAAEGLARYIRTQP